MGIKYDVNIIFSELCINQTCRIEYVFIRNRASSNCISVDIRNSIFINWKGYPLVLHSSIDDYVKIVAWGNLCIGKKNGSKLIID